MFEGLRIGFPFLLSLYGTTLFGGIFLMVAWVERVCGRKSKGLYTFTSAVLLDMFLVVYNGPSSLWWAQHEGLWMFVQDSTVVTSCILGIITLVLTSREPGSLKIGSLVLIVINLLSFTSLIYNLYFLR